MIDNYKVGNKIAALRREKGLTGEQLAELLGVSPQAVSKWENGKNLPETALLPKLAETPGVTIDALLMPQDEHLLDADFRILGAWYGNSDGFRDVMHKMEHYDYFHYLDLHVNHETFPGNPAIDSPEFLALVYLNRSGIHVVSCREGGVLTYSADRTELTLKGLAVCMIPGAIPLAWGNGMDCCWGGSLYAALKAMGEPFTYEQLMGMSGACYRLNFCEIWDWSATDALVAFDYNESLYHAIGYEMSSADRFDKDDRSAERRLIVSDIQMGKPVVAINLRTAAEWGVITGYSDGGKTLYCRTYFDGDLLDENGMVKDGGGEYLETEFWPFLISHFGKKIERPTDDELLRQSLRVLVESFEAPNSRGYYQGAEAYEKWIAGLRDNALWDERSPKDDFYRRASVNECTLRSLIEERRCTAVYLAEQGQTELAAMFRSVSESAATFYVKWLDRWDKVPSGGLEWRTEEVALLERALETERRCVEIARGV
ncbi:MAG: helix-turn-helix domain-containing protein [Oscillospiraceae bacterium]|jgi:transcriptional regulator with XRE-family HTH domain|nr:helix-turn-helix domain-containing protein [Oscillospiraceae bacterium]